MNVDELCEKAGWKIAAGDGKKDITSAYIGDLLSWVMSHGQPGTAWITVQTHENVLAVASLHDFSCVILPENIQPSPEFLDTANDKDITVLSVPCSSYGAAMVLSRLGIGEVS